MGRPGVREMLEETGGKGVQDGDCKECRADDLYGSGSYARLLMRPGFRSSEVWRRCEVYRRVTSGRTAFATARIELYLRSSTNSP
ncbi:hypothetical protein SAMN05444172_8965 [Burkholderia sp. GAS332]|nr:hypothetical protein SAMN05444172_8965 [Burkholderia sp. GAS332]